MSPPLIRAMRWVMSRTREGSSLKKMVIPVFTLALMGLLEEIIFSQVLPLNVAHSSWLDFLNDFKRFYNTWTER